jgi:hypothetical protein
VTAERTASFVITVTDLSRALHGGRRLSSIVHFGNGFPVTMMIDISDPSDAFVNLVHQTRDQRQGDRVVEERIALVWTVPTYGGRRWWFLCPRTGRRTTKLFLPNGGWHFWSRQTYDLGYACQREGRFDRLQRRAAMLNQQLGGEGWATWNTPPRKPKWMRWATFVRKLERWSSVVEKADAEFSARAMKILRRPNWPGA